MTQLHIGVDAVSVIVDQVARHGARGVETGALLLSERGKDAITLVALAGTAGIERYPGLLVFSAPALNPLFSRAEAEGLQVRAQVHSHKNGSFLSPTDKAGNIRMRGFIAAVIPTFAAPPPDTKEWGWWTFDGADWLSCLPPVVGRHSTTVVSFDSDGVHDH